MTRKTQSHGFTLIELLVIIAIISLLVAILMPSLSRAKAMARSAVCVGHLHGIGVAMINYVADHEQIVPVLKYNPSYTYGSSTGEHYMWFEHLADYAGVEKASKYQVDLDTLQDSVFWGCPDWTGVSTSGSSTPDQDKPGYAATYLPRGRTGWNSSKNWSWIDYPKSKGGWNEGRYFRYQEWILPSNHAYVGDSRTWAIWTTKANPPYFNPDRDFGYPGKWDEPEGDPERHLGRANYLMIGGNVATLNPEDGAKACVDPG